MKRLTRSSVKFANARSGAGAAATMGAPAIKRCAFTIVELIIVCFLLVTFAALIVPNVVNLRNSTIAQDAVPSIERLVGYARESAISQKTTAVLSYDSSTQSLTVKQDTTVDPNAPTISTASVNQAPGQTTVAAAAGTTPITVPSVPAVDPDNPTINSSVTLPSDFQLTDYQINGKQVASDSFQLRFYSDGTCDSGGLTFTIKTTTHSVVIDDFGRITVVDGDLPDPSSQKWEAGQFEPRQNATQ